uniref:Prefoldin subunit 5 n=1 Tax=Gongylonema pulchrum TaxID=637853 RepID=A0A183EHR1_9BILA
LTSEESVENSSKLTVNGEILVPLTDSMYIPARVADPSKYLVEIGTGYFVEMNTEKAIDYFKRKQIYLQKQMEVIEGVLPEKYRAKNAISDSLQKKLISAHASANNVSSKK